MIIRSLLGHRQVETACLCLGSLLRHCQDSPRLILHEDGTLTEADLKTLQEALGNPEIVRKIEADAVVLPLLQRFPACLDYRQDSALALKLFDICLLSPGDEPLYFCDSDVLFLRDFSFPAAIKPGEVLFMQDSDQALSLRPWHVQPLGPIRVIEKVNSGVISIHPGDLDLPFLETVLGNPRLADVFRKRPQWVEQTCWAALGARLLTFFLAPEQVSVAHEDMGEAMDEQVAIHFVSSHRGKLPRYHAQNSALRSDVSILRVKRPRTASVISLLQGEWAARKSRKQLLENWARLPASSSAT